MKIIVAVVVYDRFKNIEEWVRNWKLCEKQDSELVIIHNSKNEQDTIKFQSFCKDNDISYICRKNIGMDIGAFQDVCKDRLEGFSIDWEYLFWATDDSIPMKKNFISLYLEEIKKPNVGLVCMEVSKEVKTHARTTGFIISKETANKLVFPSDPITSKEHCYQFEHRSKDAFYEQIINMGKTVVQATADDKNAYLWDIHTRNKYNRWDEHEKEFQ
jgi:hypothetical protein